MMGKSPDVKFGIWFSTWNWGSMSGTWGQGISESLKKHTCCFQKVRPKGQGAKMTGNGFNFFWRKGCKTENSVGAMVVNWLIGKVVGVERFNYTVMSILSLGCSLGGSISLLCKD